MYIADLAKESELASEDILILIRAIDLLDTAARLTDLPFKAPCDPLVERLAVIRKRLVHEYGHETVPPTAQ